MTTFTLDTNFFWNTYTYYANPLHKFQYCLYNFLIPEAYAHRINEKWVSTLYLLPQNCHQYKNIDLKTELFNTTFNQQIHLFLILRN